jgi:nudix-type nucleoside diphosphatase (YffH/AdpP family)
MTPEIKITNTEILSKDKFELKKITFERQNKKGEWQTQEREVYDRGNAATIFLYNVKKRTLILTRQLRIPSFINGNPTGMLLETCAGNMEDGTPEECARREAEEETGYKPENVRKVMEAYMSAGGITELLYFFTGTYSEKTKVSEGGGLEEEQEEIEVLEMSFEDALALLENGEIRDAKTIMLLQYAKLQRLFDVHPTNNASL